MDEKYKIDNDPRDLGILIFGVNIGSSGKSNEFRWIIDPIDGTTNFLHGIPYFAISIGLEKNKEIICGMIFNPITNEMFYAEKGKGAYLNNSRIRVSSRKNIDECVLLTGGPILSYKNKEIFFKEYESVSRRVAATRKFGSSALDLAYLASGRCDAVWERNLNYWDVAAGIVIVKEAGRHASEETQGGGFVRKAQVGGLVCRQWSLYGTRTKALSGKYIGSLA